MKERPACRRGVEVPVKIESLLGNDKATADFVNKARLNLQR
jgi:hypothetical protein